MQSWGTRSRFDERDTETEPSKSGVLGLLCAAAGIDRDDWTALEPLTRMKMGVRVDSPGLLRRDYQTAQLYAPKVDRLEQLTKKEAKTGTGVTKKYYLADASFVAGLESDGKDLLERLHQSLKNPVYALSLGRKSCPPAEPVFLEDGLVDKNLRDALADLNAAPLLEYDKERLERRKESQGRLPAVVESDDNKGSLRYDVPAGPFSERKFCSRLVTKLYLETSES